MSDLSAGAQRIFWLGFAVLLTLFPFCPAEAHGLEFSVATTPEKMVRIGGFHEGGAGVKNAAVTVRSSADRVVFEGRTDDEGYVRFVPPGPDVYSFTVDDGAGHRIRERFVLQAFQLDGTTRDLFAEGGVPRTWLETLKNLPRWLTAIFGLSLILNLFAVFGWIRTSAEFRRWKRNHAKMKD